MNTFKKSFFTILLVIPIICYTQQLADFKQIKIGSLQSWYSRAGCEINIGRTGSMSNQQDGLRWPAQYEDQDTEVAKALWIGAANYYDPLVSDSFTYKVVHIGPNVLDEENEFMPIEFKMIGNFENPQVFVDGSQVYIPPQYDVDEIDPNLVCDRLIYNIVNTSIGITVTRKIYAFSNSNHDNYFIYDYTFKNTGIIDKYGTVYQQTLDSLIFFFLYQYAVAKEACAYGGCWLPQSATWGHSTMLHTAFTHPTTDNPFRTQFSWLGRHSKWDGPGDCIGGPNNRGDGHLGAAQYVGTIVLHADTSPQKQNNDPNQPTTTQYLDSYDVITNNNNQFNADQMSQEYLAMIAGHPVQTHAKAVGDGFADLFGGTPGGYSHGQGFGTYTLLPGDSIHIVLAEAVAGLHRESCYTVGANWMDWAYGGGTGPYTLPDGGTTSNGNEYKNEWVWTGKDSLFKTFENAHDNFNSGFNIPKAPPPPNIFEVVSDSDHISLYWSDNPTTWPGFAGYRIYRAVNRSDTSYKLLFSCGQNTGNPTIVHEYIDKLVQAGVDYYYYIVSYDDGNTNNGIPLFSSLFWTRTLEPAYLRPQPLINVDFYVDPKGDDNNSGLTQEDPLQTITCALNKVYPSVVKKNTIYLAPGIYSPSTNGENFPLDCKRYVSISGAGKEVTIIDAEGQADVLYAEWAYSVRIDNLTLQNGIKGINCNRSSSLMLSNLIIVENQGSGIYCRSSDLKLSNVTIKKNQGRGIDFNWSSSAIFDSDNRCNIFLNDAYRGADINSGLKDPIFVALDTFTVMNPSDYYAFPSSNFIFNIQNHKIEQTEADLYVDPYGDDNNSGLSTVDPLQTITQAIKIIDVDSLHHHTIHLAEGIYSPSTTGESYYLYCRSYLSISGASEQTTILDAEGTGGIIYCHSDNNFFIENLTIQNGSNCGIRCDHSTPLLKNLTIKGNTGGNGAGLYCLYNSNPVISNVTIKENIADGGGGGMYFYSNSSATFDSLNRCNIFLNEATGGEGIDLYSSQNDSIINVVLDTFTVLYPTDEYAYLLSNFNFNIMNAAVTSLSSDDTDIPTRFFLKQNHPNPFNPVTTIEYQLSQANQVDLSIYNILGQKVATLVSQKQPAGRYKVEWDASGFASGIYLYRLETDKGFVQSKKMVLLR